MVPAVLDPHAIFAQRHLRIAVRRVAALAFACFAFVAAAPAGAWNWDETRPALRLSLGLDVYRAPGTVFPARTPDGTNTVTMTEFGFPAEVRQFQLWHGESCRQTLTAEVRNAVAAQGTQLHYRLRFVRQDELTDIPTSITVKAPQSYRVTAADARFVVSKERVPLKITAAGAGLSVPLSGDLDLDVTLAR